MSDVLDLARALADDHRNGTSTGLDGYSLPAPRTTMASDDVGLPI